MRAPLLLGVAVVASWGCDHAFVFDDALPTDTADDPATDTQSAAVTQTENATSDTALPPTDNAPSTDADSGQWEAPVLFATGFEDGLPEMLHAEGLLTRDTAIVHGGTAALRAAVDANQQDASFRANFAPVTSGAIYFRAYYFAAALPRAETVNLVEFIDDRGVNVLDVNLAADRSFNLYAFAEGWADFSDPQQVYAQSWFCLQVRLDVSSSGGANVWIDGRPVVASSVPLDTLPHGGITGFRAGIVFSFPESGTVEVYLDDVVVSRMPIDC